MKLNIQSKDRPDTISEWWNGHEWQDYKLPPEDIGQCFDPNIIKETTCLTDVGNYEILDAMGMEWFYKMISYTGYKVGEGIENEIHNIINLF